MDNAAARYLKRKEITADNILYMDREDKKTSIHLAGGTCYVTYIPLKNIYSALPRNEFININKGVVLAKRHIVKIIRNEYTMDDGTTFAGRVRTPGAHTRNQEALLRGIDEWTDEESNWKQFSILGDLPIAFCVMELTDEDGNGGESDFVMRYCNKKMEEMQGKTADEVLNHSAYEVLNKESRKWLVTYEDIALNGGSKVIHDYDVQGKDARTVYAYRPKERCCACAVIRDDGKEGRWHGRI